MTKYGLRTWVILLTLAPTILVGLLLGSYFTVTRFAQIDTHVMEQGTNLIEPLSIAAENGLINNNREHLMRLITATHRKYSPAVRAITVFTVEHQIFASSNFHRQFNKYRLNKDDDIPLHTTIERDGDSILLRSPIQTIPNELDLNNAELLGYIVIHLDRSSAILNQHRAAFYTLITVILGIATCLFFTTRLIRKVTRPIGEMVDAIDSIRRGRLETRLSGQHIGELDELKSGINAMAKSISEYHSEMQDNIEQATGDLRQTLEQIEIQNVELDLAKRRAQEAARVKSEFLANMSHELRTPLNGVLGFSRQLLKTKLTGPQSDQVHTIESSAQTLLDIINDILDLSKLEAGKLTLEQVPFILRDSIDEVMQLLAPTAFQKGLDFAFIIDERVPNDLLGDALRVKQIVTNLVGNAIKFTDSGSIVVRIGLEHVHGDKAVLKLEVKDTGVGISKDQQKELFKAFSQADASTNRKFGGTGLGLIITKNLANEMEGDVGLESEINQGAYFWCTFACRLSPITLGDQRSSEILAGKTALIYEPQAFGLESIETPMHGWLMNVNLCQNKQQWHSHLSTGTHYDFVLIATDSIEPAELKTQLKQVSEITKHAVLISALSNQHELDNLEVLDGMYISHLRKPIVSTRLLTSLTRIAKISTRPQSKQLASTIDKKLPLKVFWKPTKRSPNFSSRRSKWTWKRCTSSSTGPCGSTRRWKVSKSSS